MKWIACGKIYAMPSLAALNILVQDSKISDETNAAREKLQMDRSV
jgi:hypothetical protein